MSETENAALGEARDAYQASVAIADRCRSLHEFLTGLSGEHPDVDPREMGQEAKAEQMAQFVDRQLINALETYAELMSVAHRAPKQMVVWSKAAADELKEARDALAPWRETVAPVMDA